MRSLAPLLFCFCALIACDRTPNADAGDAAADAPHREEANATIEFEGNHSIVVRARRVRDDKLVAQATVLKGLGFDSLRLAEPDTGQPDTECVASRDLGNAIAIACLDKSDAPLLAAVTLQQGVLAIEGKKVPTEDGSIVTILRSRVPTGSAEKLAARKNRDEAEARCKGIERKTPTAFKVSYGKRPEAGGDVLLAEIPELRVVHVVDDGAIADCRATASTRGVLFRCGGEQAPRFADVYVRGSSLRIDRIETRSTIMADCDAKLALDPKATCAALAKTVASCDVEAAP